MTPPTPSSPPPTEATVASQSPRRFACAFPGCSKTFSKPSRLEEHACIHTGRRPFVCPVPGCLKDYIRKTHLEAHCRVAHDDSRTFQCTVPNCSKAFALEYQLTRHSAVHARPTPFQCDICDTSFATESRLLAHRTTHTGKLKYVCKHTDCPASFSTPSKLRAHVAAIHAEAARYVCTVDSPTCTAQFRFYKELQKHISSTHRPHCTECTRDFASKWTLDQHITNVHGRISSRSSSDAGSDATTSLYHSVSVPCTWSGCSKTFRSAKTRDVHIAVRHEHMRRFACDLCPLAFAHNISLRKHIERIHPTGESIPVKPTDRTSTSETTDDVMRSILTGTPLSSTSAASQQQQEEQNVEEEADTLRNDTETSNTNATRLLEILTGHRDLELKHKCPMINCALSFHRIYDLNRHIKAVHPSSMDTTTISADEVSRLNDDAVVISSNLNN